MSSTLQLSTPKTRIPAAPTTNTPAHLVFGIDSQCYACSAKDIAHLMLLSDARLLPRLSDAPAWEYGRAQTPSRKEGIPILSLRGLWNLPPLQDATLLSRQSLLITELAGETSALLVDNCQCVLPTLPAQAPSLNLPTALTGSSGSAFKTAIQWKDTLLVIIDIHQLLSLCRRPAPGLAPNSPTFP